MTKEKVLFAASAMLLLFMLTLASVANALTIGTPIVDGVISSGEWNINTDFLAHMYIMGDPSEANVADVYARFDPATNTLYLLVLSVANPDWYIIYNSPAGDGWTWLDDTSNKVYSDDNIQTLYDHPNFAWINPTEDTADGYEAAFVITPGPHEMEVHVGVISGSVMIPYWVRMPAATVGHPDSGVTITIPPDMVVPETPLGTIAAVSSMFVALAAIGGIKRYRIKNIK